MQQIMTSSAVRPLQRISATAKALALLMVGTLALFAAGCTSSDYEQEDADNFVTVEGGQFMLNGKPHRFVGTNIWYGAYLGSDASFGDRERLKAELDLLKKSGVTNLRVLGASELSDLQNSLDPAFQDRDGAYNEELLRGLDFLLDEMRQRDMRAVIYLGNFWEWSGGMTTYLHWDEGAELVDVDDPDEPWWPAYPRLAAQFYSSKAANTRYRAYVDMITSRKNSLTGVTYSQDPTIMSWQLANEPRPGFGDAGGRANIPAMVRWIGETAAYIKSRAPEQLVSTGNEGVMGCVESEECYRSAHQIEEIDYLTFHMWPKNWSWIDAQRMEETYPNTIKQASAYIERHLEFAKELGKPIVLEEFGLERDGGAIALGSSVLLRDKFYGEIFGAVETSASACGAFAGTNFWAWGGSGRAERPSALWKTGDTSYVGDPPQEPQGLNSVFDNDRSTLAVVKQHADALRIRNSAC